MLETKTMTKQTSQWARWPAICLAALSILAFSSTADAQWGRDGAVRRPPGTYDRGRAYNPAYSNGFEEGYKEGRDDARDGDRFDPRRHGRYRSGDHGYNSRYGPRAEYKQYFRSGFSQGYERGYREGLRNGRGRWNDRRDRFPWWR
jgi:hypothetical protein